MFITVSFAVLFLIVASVCCYFGVQDKYKRMGGVLALMCFISLFLSIGLLSSLQTYSGGRPMDYKDLEVGTYRLFSTYQDPSDNGYITVLIQKNGEKVVRSVVFKKEDWRVEKKDEGIGGYITVETRTIDDGTEKQEKIAY
jgi:hypothetical protein